MTRSNFFKSFLTLIAAPKILAEIGKPNIIPFPTSIGNNGKCPFNEKALSERIDYLKKYPPPKWAEYYVDGTQGYFTRISERDGVTTVYTNQKLTG